MQWTADGYSAVFHLSTPVISQIQIEIRALLFSESRGWGFVRVNPSKTQSQLNTEDNLKGRV